MGGPGKEGTTTPEHLFAAGYAACFGGALDFVGKKHKKNATGAKITCGVSIGPRDAGGFGIAVKLQVEDKSLPQAEAAGARQRGARADLPLLARHAQQRAGGTDGDGRLSGRRQAPGSEPLMRLPT